MLPACTGVCYLNGIFWISGAENPYPVRLLRHDTNCGAAEVGFVS
jgi:hypothetical protein